MLFNSIVMVLILIIVPSTYCAFMISHTVEGFQMFHLISAQPSELWIRGTGTEGSNFCKVPSGSALILECSDA